MYARIPFYRSAAAFRALEVPVDLPGTSGIVEAVNNLERSPDKWPVGGGLWLVTFYRTTNVNPGRWLFMGGSRPVLSELARILDPQAEAVYVPRLRGAPDTVRAAVTARADERGHTPGACTSADDPPAGRGPEGGADAPSLSE